MKIYEEYKIPPRRSFQASHYFGRRLTDGCFVTRHNSGLVEPLHWRLDLWNHSPTGLEWGYAGSGPAQLALALLADALEDADAAVSLYQFFKQDVIARLPHQEWSLTLSEILCWVDSHTENLGGSKRSLQARARTASRCERYADAAENVFEGEAEALVDVVDEDGAVRCRQVRESVGNFVAAKHSGWLVVKRLEP